jgi:hypothetical protein
VYKKRIADHYKNCSNVLQDPQLVDMKYISTLDIFFESAEDVLAFYVRYAQLACFDVRRNKTRNNGRAQEVECKASGHYKGGPGPDRTCSKTTNKKKYKAMVCIARSATQSGR